MDQVLGIHKNKVQGAEESDLLVGPNTNRNIAPTRKYAYTVEILIMHIVIMHNSHNALSFRGSRVGIRGKWVNIAYCIMHEGSRSIMHYEDTL